MAKHIWRTPAATTFRSSGERIGAIAPPCLAYSMRSRCIRRASVEEALRFLRSHATRTGEWLPITRTERVDGKPRNIPLLDLSWVPDGWWLVALTAGRARTIGRGVVAGWSDLQDRADRLDSPALTVSADEPHHFLGRRGSSPAAKKAEAADRWTWLVTLAYTQLRLARRTIQDVRLPWQRPQRPDRRALTAIAS